VHPSCPQTSKAVLPRLPSPASPSFNPQAILSHTVTSQLPLVDLFSGPSNGSEVPFYQPRPKTARQCEPTFPNTSRPSPFPLFPDFPLQVFPDPLFFKRKASTIFLFPLRHVTSYTLSSLVFNVPLHALPRRCVKRLI